MTTLGVLLAQIMASTAMAAIAWFVQMVHYPLFALLQPSGTDTPGGAGMSPSAARDYHNENVRRTRPIVLVPMVVEAASAAWLAWFPPAAVGRGAALGGLALVAVVVLSTALVQVPLHESLRGGDPSPDTVARLVRSTGVRTAAWTARAVLAAWMIRQWAVAG
jgi:hypothetical protein